MKIFISIIIISLIVGIILTKTAYLKVSFTILIIVCLSIIFLIYRTQLSDRMVNDVDITPLFNINLHGESNELEKLFPEDNSFKKYEVIVKNGVHIIAGGNSTSIEEWIRFTYVKDSDITINVLKCLDDNKAKEEYKFWYALYKNYGIYKKFSGDNYEGIVTFKQRQRADIEGAFAPMDTERSYILYKSNTLIIIIESYSSINSDIQDENYIINYISNHMKDK